MSRNLKVLGLALVAVLAFSAVAAAGASAVTHKSQVSSTPMTLTGEQEGNHVFSLPAHNDGVECTVSHFEGTQTVTVAETVRMHPEYGGLCETKGGLEATVDTNECDYVFYGATDENEHAAVDIDCDHGAPIEVDVGHGLCLIEVGDTHDEDEVNQGLRGVHYNNVEDEGREGVTVEATVTNITYRTTGAFCAFAGFEDGGTTHDGTYTGNTIVTDKAKQGDVTMVE